MNLFAKIWRNYPITRYFCSCNAEGAAERWLEVSISFMEVLELDEVGQSWVEVEGAVGGGVDGLAISNLELNFDHISEKTRI